MVTKSEKGFSIEVDCGTHPANDYVEMTHSIVDVLQAQNNDFSNENYYLLQLLKEMLPTFDQAKVMLDGVRNV